MQGFVQRKPLCRPLFYFILLMITKRCKKIFSCTAIFIRSRFLGALHSVVSKLLFDGKISLCASLVHIFIRVLCAGERISLIRSGNMGLESKRRAQQVR